MVKHKKGTINQLTLPTPEQAEVKEKVLKVCKWLETHRDHPKYEQGIKFVKDKLDKYDLIDWFLSQDVEFMVSMEIYNRPSKIYEYAKKLFF